jgi:hypothetical protein
MRTIRLAPLAAFVPCLIVLATLHPRGEMSGDRGRPIVMQGAIPGDDGQDRCRLSVEIERVGFLLNTVQGRYKLARVRVENLGTSRVPLSVDRDRLELELGSGEAVPAVLNLQRGDSTFWDSLSADMRQILAYPAAIKAGRAPSAGASPEIVYLYALFPADRVTDMPRAFTYRIDSIGQPVRIAHRATAALP